MRILLDTNIIIHREASKVRNADIGKLFNWFDKTKATKIVHPLTIQEISTHMKYLKLIKLVFINRTELGKFSAKGG